MLPENTTVLSIHSFCPKVINQYCWPEIAWQTAWYENLYSKAEKEQWHSVCCGSVQWLNNGWLHFMWKPYLLSASAVKPKAWTRSVMALDCKTQSMPRVVKQKRRPAPYFIFFFHQKTRDWPDNAIELYKVTSWFNLIRPFWLAELLYRQFHLSEYAMKSWQCKHCKGGSFCIQWISKEGWLEEQLGCFS